MRRGGFTLVETVIGLAIIGVAFYFLITVFTALAPRTARVETIDKKTFLAQEKMEEFLARPFTQIASVGATSFTGAFSSFRYQIVVTPAATSELNVKVMVWGGPVDSAGTVEVVTLFVNL